MSLFEQDIPEAHRIVLGQCIEQFSKAHLKGLSSMPKVRLTYIPQAQSQIQQLDDVWVNYHLLLQKPAADNEGDFCPIVSREERVIQAVKKFAKF